MQNTTAPPFSTVIINLERAVFVCFMEFFKNRRKLHWRVERTISHRWAVLVIVSSAYLSDNVDNFWTSFDSLASARNHSLPSQLAHRSNKKTPLQRIYSRSLQDPVQIISICSKKF